MAAKQILVHQQVQDTQWYVEAKIQTTSLPENRLWKINPQSHAGLHAECPL
jgi:hypothetical protein